MPASPAPKAGELTPTASILTIGNELVSGDVPNTNAAWLARRLAPLGVAVRLAAALPDEIDTIAEFVRAETPRADFLLVTGGLGGTPDDLTREAIAAAFGVPQEEVPEVAADLRARFTRDPEYAARWAQLPRGSRPLVNPLGGAPGFARASSPQSSPRRASAGRASSSAPTRASATAASRWRSCSSRATSRRSRRRRRGWSQRSKRAADGR